MTGSLSWLCTAKSTSGALIAVRVVVRSSHDRGYLVIWKLSSSSTLQSDVLGHCTRGLPLSHCYVITGTRGQAALRAK